MAGFFLDTPRVYSVVDQSSICSPHVIVKDAISFPLAPSALSTTSYVYLFFYLLVEQCGRQNNGPTESVNI